MALAGTWGDSFGGFNALVGAIGFGALVGTFYLQYHSFEQQKQEQHVARFEENFFRLLNLMRDLRSDLTYRQTAAYQRERPDYAFHGAREGYAAIEAAYREVNHWTFKAHQGAPMRRGVVAAQYNNYVHHRFESCFAPYFRIIYTILNRIRSDQFLSLEQKFEYGNIVRSQLTSFEIGLLAFNATSKYAKDLDQLLDFFRMLKYLPQKRRRVLRGIYPPSTYEART